MKTNLHNKRFKSIDNSENGEVSGETVFHYRQQGNKFWASYEGGSITIGTLVGKIKRNRMTLVYQQINKEGEFLSGCCHTSVSVEKGKIRLHEKWQWTCKDYSSGYSVLEEI